MTESFVGVTRRVGRVPAGVPHRNRGWRASASVAVLAAMLGGAVLQPGSAQAQAAAAASDAGAGAAINLLLEKAQFWYEKGQLPVALDFYTRVLGLQPDNRDALAGSSKVLFDQGHEIQAREFLERLRKVSPDDPFLTAFDTLKRRTPEDAATLLEARTLAAQGKKEAALAKYRQLFKGDVIPADLASDYYPLYVSSLPDESVEADQALTAVKELAEKNPKDINLQLAAAWSLILTTGGRTEGMERLAKLEKIPAMTERANSLWRQALLWEGPALDSQEHLENYLKTHPSDPQLEAKRAEYVASLPDIGVRSRWKAGDAIEAKDYKAAEGYLKTALDFDKTDAEAMGMMSLVKKLTGNVAESQRLYKEAIRLAPDKQEEFDRMLGLDAERAVNEKYRQVERLTDAGKYDEAEALLRSLLAGQRNPGSYLQLATIQGKAGKTDAALASLQVVLSADPNNPDANQALAEIYMGQKRYNDAKPLLARAEAGYQAKKDARGLSVIHAAQAEIMRVDALTLSDPAARERALRQAQAVDPSNWWIKLELARAMKEGQHDADAQALMDDAYRTASKPGALNTRDGQDALQVAFIWAQDAGDRKRADALVRMVPQGQRTASMSKFLAMAAFKQQVRDLVASGDPAAADKLDALAAVPDPTGERGAEIGLAFLRMQDIDSMRNALATCLEVTKPQTAVQRISYAGVLMQASQFTAASTVIAPLDTMKLTAAEREALENTRDALVVGTLDPLLQQKQYARAQQAVQARLAVHPDNVNLQAAMARIQVAQGNAQGVVTGLRASLDKDPSNLAVRLTLIEAESKLQHFATVSDLAEDGMKIYPRNPYLVIQAANAARARGFRSEALDLMVKARALLNQSGETAPVQTN